MKPTEQELIESLRIVFEFIDCATYSPVGYPSDREGTLIDGTNIFDFSPVTHE